MVAVGNGANVGGGTELTPDADPESGLLDVMISLAVCAERSVGYAVRCAAGRHHERDDVLYLRGRERLGRRARSSGPRADGEIYGPSGAGPGGSSAAAYSHGAADR